MWILEPGWTGEGRWSKADVRRKVQGAGKVQVGEAVVCWPVIGWSVAQWEDAYLTCTGWVPFPVHREKMGLGDGGIVKKAGPVRKAGPRECQGGSMDGEWGVDGEMAPAGAASQEASTVSNRMRGLWNCPPKAEGGIRGRCLDAHPEATGQAGVPWTAG